MMGEMMSEGILVWMNDLSITDFFYRKTGQLRDIVIFILIVFHFLKLNREKQLEGGEKMAFSGRKMYLLTVLILVLVGLTFGACGFSTVRVRRDLDTTGYDVQAFYLSGGGRVENQGVQIVGSDGKDLGNLVFESSAGSRTERLERFNPARGVNETTWRMTQYSTSEDIFGIREANYIIQRQLLPGRPDLVVLKSEIKFRFSLTLNKVVDQDFEIGCLYYLQIPEGEEPDGDEIVGLAQAWFAKLVYKTVLRDRWSPYNVSITNARICTELPANWAQVNEYFDEAILLAQGLVHDLARHNWEGLSRGQGQIYKMNSNPTGLLDVVGFESPFTGWALNREGVRYDFRFAPFYNILHHQNPEYWYGKQNSRNRSLEALVLSVAEDGIYEPRAVLFFIKSRWAKNGLYALKRLDPGESPIAVIKRVYALIDMDIPEDVQAAYEEGNTEEVARWSAEIPPFNMEQVGADFAAVVDVIDVTETYQGRDSDGGSVEVKGVQAKKGTYHLQGDTLALEYFLTLLGEHAVEYLDLGYIQPNGGDGIGFVTGIVDLIERYNVGEVDFDDTARIDQRSPESPEMVERAIKYFIEE